MDLEGVDRLVGRGLSRRAALGVLGAGAVVLAGCGGDDGGGGGGAGSSSGGGAAGSVEGKKSGKLWNLTLLTNEWNTVMQDAAERTAKLLGCQYGESVFEGDESVALRQAEQAASAGAVGWMMQGADGAGVPAIARLANKQKIWMSNMFTTAQWYTPFDADPYFVWFMTGSDDQNFYESTKYMLQQIADDHGEEAKLLHVTGIPGGSLENQRTAAAKRAVAEFPGMKIVGSLPGQWSAQGGQKATEDLISRFGTPQGIISQNDGALTGVLAALNGLGLKAGEEVKTCGADGASDILKAIEAGLVSSTCFTSPAYFGVSSMVRVFDALNGVKFTAPERQMGLIGITVTKDNASGVIKRYVDNENLPFDPRLMSQAISGDKFDPMFELHALRMDDYWGSAGAPKPTNYRYPPEYQKALDAGDLEKTDELYAKNYKIKSDDFDYEGVAV